MLTRFMFAIVALLPAAAALGDTPKDLAKLFPKDTLGFACRAGADAAGRMAEGTSFGDLVADPEMRRFTTSVCAAIDGFIRAQARNEGVPPEMVEGSLRVLHDFWTRPVAMGVIDFQLSEDKQSVDAAIVCHVGKDAARLAADVEALLVTAGAPAQEVEFAGHKFTIADPDEKDFRPLFGAVGEYFVILHGERSAEVIQRIETGGPNLSDDETLAACRNRIAGDDDTRSMAMYINVDRVAAKLKALAVDIAGPDRGDVEKVCSVLNALGLENLAGVAWESHYRKGGCYDAMYFHTPGGGRGLLAAGGKAITEDDLQLIPKNARWASAANVELAAGLRALLTHAKSMDPEAAQHISGVESIAQGVLGMPPVDFLELFGDTFVVYDAPDSGGIWFTGAVLIVDCRDTDKAEKAMTQLVRSVASMIAGEVAMDVKTLEHKDYKIRYINAAGQPVPVAPAWAVRDGRLIMGLYPQMVASTLDRLAEGNLRDTSILANEDFKKARSVLGDLGTSFTYTNTTDGVRALYPFALIAGQIGAAMAQGEGIDIDVTAIPSLRTLEKYIHGQVQFTQTNGDGTLVTSYGAIPFGVNSMAPASVMVAPMTAAILLPSLSRARELSKRTVCAADLRGIGQAMYIHAQDDGRFPSDFQTLIDENNITTKMLICPSTNHVVGDALDACYVIVPGQTTYSDPSNVLVYERRENHDGEGVNVLFQDGHVQFISIEELDRRLEETRQRLEKAGN
ncbi:MAG: hypothetical protein H6818_10255 [Phycisphaerales bacterium]|nr:hypothetical protein [Phycisphaerales bacterium]MCB9863916.1 hypothetical protein [Phycisphaerales bacterium]